MIGSNVSVDEVCSRAGCQTQAEWDINWRNPRIHSVDRVKTWLACDEHRDFLRDYLAARDFPVLVAKHGTIVDSVPDVTPDATPDVTADAK